MVRAVRWEQSQPVQFRSRGHVVTVVADVEPIVILAGSRRLVPVLMRMAVMIMRGGDSPIRHGKIRNGRAKAQHCERKQADQEGLRGRQGCMGGHRHSAV